MKLVDRLRHLKLAITGDKLPPTNIRQEFTSGTRVQSGRFFEEANKKLTGQDAADIYDDMRRSDPATSLVVNATLQPLQTAEWTIVPYSEDPADPDYKIFQEDAEFARFQLFDDMYSKWTKRKHEMLTYFIFGHSVHYKIHKQVMNHPDWGNYTGFEDLVFISPKTIDQWNVDRQTGRLKSILQRADGDMQAYAEIPAEFLSVLSLQMEGDNYEGISGIRSVYGSWYMKGKFQQMAGIGMERAYLGLPIFRIPKTMLGTVADAERKRLEEICAKLTDASQNYVGTVEGVEFEFLDPKFNGDHAVKMLTFQNEEILRAGMISWLALGTQGTTGNRAVGDEQSNFFVKGLRFLAEGPCDMLTDLSRELILLNRGPRRGYPYAKCTGIGDDAGQEFIDAVQKMKSAGALTWSPRDEAMLRQLMKLPEMIDVSLDRGNGGGEADDPGEPGDPGTEGEETDPPAPTPAEGNKGGEPAKAARRSGHLTLAAAGSNPQKIMDFGAEALGDIMRSNLRFICDSYVESLMKSWRKLPDSQRSQAISKAEPAGVKRFEDQLFNALINLSTKALDQAITHTAVNPVTFHVKLADPMRINLPFKQKDFKNLPAHVRNGIRQQAKLLATSAAQLAAQRLAFQYGNALSSTDSEAIMQQYLEEKSAELVAGADKPALLAAAKAVNETRHYFFFDPEIIEQIESFTFTNPDPVTEICTFLNGKTFERSNAQALEYEPPLHWGCKSYLVANELDAGVELDWSAPPKEVLDAEEINLCEHAGGTKSEWDEWLECESKRRWFPPDRQQLAKVIFDRAKFSLQDATDWCTSQAIAVSQSEVSEDAITLSKGVHKSMALKMFEVEDGIHFAFQGTPCQSDRSTEKM